MDKSQKEKARNVLKLVIDEYSIKPFAELGEMVFPQIRTYTVEQKAYQVEIDKLESTNEYIHISVGVSAGGISNYLPFSHSFLVYKDGKIER